MGEAPAPGASSSLRPASEAVPAWYRLRQPSECPLSSIHSPISLLPRLGLALTRTTRLTLRQHSIPAPTVAASPSIPAAQSRSILDSTLSSVRFQSMDQP